MFKKYLNGSKKANHIRIGVGILLYFQEYLILEKRADCQQWGLIGGGVEVGEEISEAAARECFEETSIKLRKDKLELINIYSDVKEFRIIQYPDSCFHAIDIIFSYEVSANISIKKSNESLDIKSFHIKDLPANLVPPAKYPIRDFIENKFGNIQNNEITI